MAMVGVMLATPFDRTQIYRCGYVIAPFVSTGNEWTPTDNA